MTKAQCIFPAFAIFLIGCATTPSPANFLKQSPAVFRATRGFDQVVLLGTMHVPFSEKDVPSHIRAELMNSEVFISEADAVSAYLSNEDNGIRYYPTPKHTLRDDLSPKAFEMVVAALNNQHSVSEIEVMQPRYALSLFRDRQRETSPSTFPIANVLIAPIEPESDLFDIVLQKVALMNGKKTVALESMSNELLRHCDYLDAVAEIERDAVKDGFNNSSAVSEKATFASNHCTREERNLAWLPLIEAQIIHSKRIFVAVGVAHVVLSTPSLLDLLAEQGFKIERIDP
jgi:uncharacterized protein YbaP (TraB family)